MKSAASLTEFLTLEIEDLVSPFGLSLVHDFRVFSVIWMPKSLQLTNYEGGIMGGIVAEIEKKFFRI